MLGALQQYIASVHGINILQQYILQLFMQVPIISLTLWSCLNLPLLAIRLAYPLFALHCIGLQTLLGALLSAQMFSYVID